MDLPPTGHAPVLLPQVLNLLNPQQGQTFIDCTVGRAGHALAIADRLGRNGLLIGLDVDPHNLEFSRQRLSNASCRVRLFHANFAELADLLRQIGSPQVHGLLADLGPSTNQFFDPRYGLSFSQDMPLDMRLDPRLQQTAADLVNRLPEKELADVLFELAQERHSRRIAGKIVEARQIWPITSTERLAEIVRSAIGWRKGIRPRIDPATRTFLALRMKVNRELENLSILLHQAPELLTRGGRLAIISFQSSEDRMVKQAFRSAEQTGLLRLLTKKPLVPSDSEIAANPRSRSAKLRAAERI